MPRTSAKIGKPTERRKSATNPLDRYSEKPRKGRPPRIPASWVRGRADNHRDALKEIWKQVWPGLSTAKTREDVVNALSGADVSPAYALQFVSLADVILQVVTYPKFPKRNEQAQVNFLSDSIAGHGTFTPRSSRDICEKERARIKKVHRILCYEYYVECSCGYKGHSRKHACPRCEAEIQFPNDLPLSWQ